MLTIIENVRIYEPADLGVGDIVFCGEKIIDVGAGLAKSYPTARRIRGEGLSAVPGYIDQHVHITGGGGEGSFKTRLPELQLSQCIKAGVTTVVGLLGTDGLTRSIENLVAKTKGLNEEGITAYCLTGSYAYPSLTLTGDLKKDIAYIQEVIGVKIAISDHRSSHVTKQELIRLASDVRLASLMSGKPGIITFHTGRGKEQLDLIFEIVQETELPIKHFRPTHVSNLREAAVKFAKMGGYIDFTASVDAEAGADTVIEAVKAGAPLDKITLSSDSNGSFPKWNERNEIIGLEAASMDTLHGLIKALAAREEMGITKALSLVTANAAAALELENKKGRLKAGLDADILLLRQDLSIEGVIARGQVMMENGEVVVKGTFE